MDEILGPSATPRRAVEIATMEQFGLREFIELTGIGAGVFGIYRVGPVGVSLAPVAAFSAADLSGYTKDEQEFVLAATEIPALTFHCTPAAFMTWYDSTRGTGSGDKRGVGEFPLVETFEREVRRREGASPDRSRLSFPSTDIIAAFAVRADPRVNAAWWGARLRDPAKYGGPSLVAARAMKGHPKIRSRWYPDVVAAWLIDRELLPRDVVIKAIEDHFPGIDADLLR